jgi:hypothetical protein
MTTENKKLVFDVGGEASTAIKVGNELRAYADELYLAEYVTQDNYVKKLKPQTPANTTVDCMRRYDVEMADFKTEVDHLRKLREAAKGYLTTAAYEQLCVRMGRSTADSLNAREILDGIEKHYCKMTSSQSEDIVKSLQLDWDVNTSLSAHVIKHATKFAELKAGKRAQSDQVSKETLWRTLTALKTNPVYSMSLSKPMRISAEDESVTMPQYVADFLAELQEEQYADLNADSKPAEATEAVLSVKEKESREQKFKERQKANRAKYATHPLGDQCPVHASSEHTWGSCSHYTGKKFFANKKK